MLAKDPAQRPQSMEEVVAKLDALRHSPTLPAAGQPVVPPAPQGQFLSGAAGRPSAAPMVAGSIQPLMFPAPPAMPPWMQDARRRNGLLLGALVLVLGGGIVAVGTHKGKVHLTIVSTPLGASVTEGGKEVGHTPFTDTIPPGEGQATYLLTLKDYQPTAVILSREHDDSSSVQLVPVKAAKKDRSDRDPRIHLDIPTPAGHFRVW
jgi:hypothetical protein